MRFVVTSLMAAFVLHIAWEFAVCGVFYVEKLFPLTGGGMLWVTAGDVVLTTLIYGFVAACVRDQGWGEAPFSSGRLAIAVAAGAAFAVAVEMHALATGRWSYSELMPIVPFVGVGLLPVVQLALLTPVSLSIAQRVARGRVSPRERTSALP